MKENIYIKNIIKLAKKAKFNDDVPVGAIIVENEKVISKGYNKKYKKNNAISHAEIEAIIKACKRKKSTYLNDCIMYVTLEPCMMCTGAILQSHIKKIVYCAKSPKYGYISKIKNKNIEIEYIENDECINLIQTFFKEKRKVKS